MTRKNKENNTEKLLGAIVDGILEVKGEDINCLDLRKIDHAIADYFVICHGNSHTQVDAIAKSVERETEKQLNESPWHKEGLNNAEWVLLDYSNIVVHVFYKEARPFYSLEELWADAELRNVVSDRA